MTLAPDGAPEGRTMIHLAAYPIPLVVAPMSFGEEFVNEWRENLNGTEWRRYAYGLHHARAFIDRLCTNDVDLVGNPLPVGNKLPDCMVPGTVFLLYANAAPHGGLGGGFVGLGDLLDRHDAHAALSERQRAARVLSFAVEIHPRRRTKPVDLGISKHQAIEMAGLLLTGADIEKLSEVEDGIPSASILAETTFRGGPAINMRRRIGRLPGRWLGTSIAAGRA